MLLLPLVPSLFFTSRLASCRACLPTLFWLLSFPHHPQLFSCNYPNAGPSTEQLRQPCRRGATAARTGVCPCRTPCRSLCTAQHLQNQPSPAVIPSRCLEASPGEMGNLHTLCTSFIAAESGWDGNGFTGTALLFCIYPTAAPSFQRVHLEVLGRPKSTRAWSQDMTHYRPLWGLACICTTVARREGIKFLLKVYLF